MQAPVCIGPGEREDRVGHAPGRNGPSGQSGAVSQFAVTEMTVAPLAERLLVLTQILAKILKILAIGRGLE